MGSGLPSFTPDFSCPALLKRRPNALLTAPTGLSPTLAPRSRRLWIVKADRLWRMTVRPGRASNPHAARPVSLTRRRFRPPPVRSPLLRGCFLFLGVHEMFQFPRCPPQTSCGHHTRWWGCPIRKSRDQSLLAAPPRVSSQCHVLHRHAAPRHPPVAPNVFPGGTLDAGNAFAFPFLDTLRCTLVRYTTSTEDTVLSPDGVPSPLNRDDGLS